MNLLDGNEVKKGKDNKMTDVLRRAKYGGVVKEARLKAPTGYPKAYFKAFVQFHRDCMCKSSRKDHIWAVESLGRCFRSWSLTILLSGT